MRGSRRRLPQGYKRYADYNGEDQEGVGMFQMTMKNGQRCSAARAYLGLPESEKSGNHHPAHTTKIM